MNGVLLSRREASTVVRLLGILQAHLESAIESCLVPGETKVRDPEDKPYVALDRRHWAQAERLVKKLSIAGTE